MVGFRTRVAFRGQLESRNSCEPGVTTLILARCPDPLHGWIRDDLLPRNLARIESMEGKKEGRRERKNRSSPIVEITAIIARVRCFLPVAEEEHHLNHEWFINFTPGSQRSAAALEQSQTRRAQLKFSNFNKVSPARIHRGSRFGSFLDLVLRGLIVINRCFSNTRFITIMPRVSFHYSSSIPPSGLNFREYDFSLRKFLE